LGTAAAPSDEPLELAVDDAGFVLLRVHRRRRPARQLELGGVVRAPVVVVARVGMPPDARYLAGQLVATRLCFSRDYADIRTADHHRLVVQVAGIGHALHRLGVLRDLTVEELQLLAQGLLVDAPVAMLRATRVHQLIELAQLHVGDVAARSGRKGTALRAAVSGGPRALRQRSTRSRSLPRSPL